MTAARGFIGAGEIYLNRTVAGVPIGLAGPYEAKKFEIKVNVKSLPLIDRSRARYGQTVVDVSVNEPPTFSIELTEVGKDALTSAFMGSATASSQASGTLTSEAVVAKLGFWVALSKADLTGSPTVTNNAVSTTYVEGTDYSVNAQMGWISALPGGAISDGQTIKVTSTYAAFSNTTIAGATVDQILAKVVFVGINLVDQLPCIVTVPEGLIAAEDAFDFLNSEFSTVTLPGSMRTPDGAATPFTVDFRT